MKSLGILTATCGLVIAALVAATSGCLATTWYVDTAGSDSNAGTSSATAFADLYKAVSVVHAGDTIDIDAGTYILENETLGNGYPVNVTTSGTSTSPIIIQSTPGQSAIINATGLWNGLTDGIDLSGNYITVQNLIVENAPGYDIDILTGSNDIVQTCTATGGGWGGVIIGGANATVQMSSDEILGCTIHDNVMTNVNGNGPYGWGSAVDASNCQNCTIQNNFVYHNWGEGIDCYPNDYSGGTGTTTNVWVCNNTVYDNFSVEIYLNCAQNIYVWNNMVYADANAILRGGYPAAGIQVDNEMASPVPPCANCQIINNIVVGGVYAFAYENGNTWSGFYAGGLNGFGIYNNVFYNGNSGTVLINNDSGNNFTFENNIAWQTTNSTLLASNGGGGTQVLKTNCWDGQGSNNMNMTGDVILSNTNPGFVSAGSTSPAGWVLNSSSPCYTSGTNATSVFTFDFNWATRPSSGAWTMGAFVGATLTSTTTALTSSTNPSTYGGSVTFTATVSPSVPNGETVTFYNGGTSIGTGTTSSSKATLTTTSLPAGSDGIKATYAGDATYASSTSSTLTQTVNKASTTTTLTSSLNPSTSGASVTFTATVSPTVPNGETVTFYNGGTSMGTGTTSSSKATYSTSSLTVGSHSITATYAGDTNYATSTSSVLTQVVNSSGWSGIYRFVNHNSGMALDCNASKTTGSTVVQKTTSAGNTQQEWTIVTDSDGYYRFVNVYSGLALDCNGSTTAGTNEVEKTSNTGYWDQEWQIVSDGSGYYSLVNHTSGMVPDTNNSTTSGTAVIQNTNNSTYWTQQFQLVAD